MITFSCPACQKKLSVNDGLAGKKAKCPGCGQPVAIPGPDAATLPPSASPDATHGASRDDAGHDSSLTDFLSPPQADDELGRLGKCRILKVLGHGGMGVVFKAEDARLKRIVALKAMLPAMAASASAGKRFLREAQAMAAVHHDHIVTIFQVDEERGVPFLVMEFLKGEPLDERLKRTEKLTLAEVLRIGREMAEGLEAAHATGLIHRDIKPANVWIEAPRGRVKILDFGLARAAAEDSNLTQQGAIMGTPAFMAPEQGRGEAVDARSDLFSLGVVLYRLCTGQQPFKGKDPISTIMEVALHQPPPPRQVDAAVPQGLSDLVMRLLEKDAALRPASAGEVAETLRVLERKLGRQEEPPGETVALAVPLGKPADAAPRRRLLLLVVAASLLIGVGAFALIRSSSEQGDYVIDTDDPDFSFQVSKGTVTLRDLKANREYDLKVVRQDNARGEHELEAADLDDGLSFKTRTVTVKRGERVALKAWLERKEGVHDAWLKQVAAMPAEKQVQAVIDKLKELNSGFDGKVTHKVEAGVATVFQVVTDHVTDISPLRVFTGLRVLDCSGTSSPDLRPNGRLADLTPLKGMDLTDLTVFHMNWTQVGDAGLARFKDCKNLTHLGLVGTKVSDAGLAHFKDCKGLVHLDLGWTEANGTRVTDAGLAHFKDRKGLTELYLNGTPASDLGLAHFKGCKHLTGLGLNGTRVSDAGLAYFKDCKNLTRLWLNGTRVSDAGMVHFKDCKNLTEFLLQKTNVTAAMVAELKKALPKCRIEWDGGALKPTAGLDPDREAAEHVLSIDGVVRVNDQDQEIKAAADLPKEAFRLTWVNLSGTQVGDAGLAHFKDCKNLTRVNLHGTQVGDAGLAHFKGCTGLAVLDLSHTQVGDAGLATFKDCKRLVHFDLAGTKVGDAGLAHFKGCTGLAVLDLSHTKVGDAGLAYFKDCKSLTRLGLNGTQVGDAGLAHFKDCKGLTILLLDGTKVSDAGLARFKDCKNLTNLWLGNTQVGDAGLAHFKDCKNLMILDLTNMNVSDVGLAHFAGCKNLTELYLGKTKVTAAKIEELKKALPKCRIEWDGGVIRPKE